MSTRTFIALASVILPLLLVSTAQAAEIDLETTDLTKAPVTRLEFTLTVVDLYYANESTENCFRNIAPTLPPHFTHLFKDVEITEPYAKDLCIAMYVGLVNGKNDASFHPDEPITIAEASKILAKAHGLTYPAKVQTGLPWYWSSMEAMRQAKAIDTRMLSSTVVTWSQMLTMLDVLKSVPRYPEMRIIGREPSHSPIDLCAGLVSCAFPHSIDDEPAIEETAYTTRRLEGNKPSRRMIIENARAQ